MEVEEAAWLVVVGIRGSALHERAGWGVRGGAGRASGAPLALTRRRSLEVRLRCSGRAHDRAHLEPEAHKPEWHDFWNEIFELDEKAVSEMEETEWMRNTNWLW